MGRKKPSHGTFHGTAVMCITPRYHPNCTKLFPAPVPLDAPITWDRTGGDYSCSPPLLKSDSAPLRTHRLSPAPALWNSRPRCALFFLAFIPKNIAVFVRFVNMFFTGYPLRQALMDLTALPEGEPLAGPAGRESFFASEAEVLRAHSNTSSFNRAMSRSIRATRLKGVMR